MARQQAYAYLRVSGLGQVEGDGFPRQLAAVKKCADERGLKVVHVYQEQGVSGTVDGLDRPAWSELMAAVLSDGVRTVIVESLGRLARDLFVQEYILRDLARRNVTLLSATEPDLGSTDPTRVMVRQVLGAIHQYERSMIVAKLKAARDRIKAKGQRCEGRKPYGHYPGEGAYLERMNKLRAEGETFDSIAALLNSCGVMTRGGTPWRGATVCKILRRAGA